MKPQRSSAHDSGSGGGLSWGAGLLLVALLVLPVMALRQLDLRMDWRGIAVGWVVLCIITYFLYRADKRRAETGEWRIPESTLHLAELLGGWPGGYLAQRMYRHKTSKLSFKVIFWIIVLAHQLVAGDVLADGRLSNGALLFIRNLVT